MAHTTKVFDADLQELARATAEMGGLAERQIAEAIKALMTRDGGRAQRIIAADATIDVMQRNIEERAIETIARRQPVADDLRQIVGILRIANEIERIGDLAKNIGKRIVAINDEETPRMLMSGVDHMATLMLTQLRDVLDSFARRTRGVGGNRTRGFGPRFSWIHALFGRWSDQDRTVLAHASQRWSCARANG